MLPELLRLGPIQLHSYGIMMVLGMAAGVVTATRFANRRGISGDILLRASVFIILSGLVGSRLLYVIMYSAEFSGRWQYAFLPIQPDGTVGLNGLVFLGGVIGGVLAGLWYVLYHRLPPWPIADSIAPGLAVGLFFGRIGCFLNGCCFGRSCDLPWAVHFPADSSAALLNGQQALHPTQLYAAGYALLIFGLITIADRYRPPQGYLAALFLIFYGISRFTIDFFRYQDSEMLLGVGINLNQFISLLMFFGGLSIIAINRDKRRRIEISRPA